MALTNGKPVRQEVFDVGSGSSSIRHMDSGNEFLSRCLPHLNHAHIAAVNEDDWNINASCTRQGAHVADSTGLFFCLGDAACRLSLKNILGLELQSGQNALQNIADQWACPTIMMFRP